MTTRANILLLIALSAAGCRIRSLSNSENALASAQSTPSLSRANTQGNLVKAIRINPDNISASKFQVYFQQLTIRSGSPRDAAHNIANISLKDQTFPTTSNDAKVIWNRDLKALTFKSILGISPSKLISTNLSGDGHDNVAAISTNDLGSELFSSCPFPLDRLPASPQSPLAIPSSTLGQSTVTANQIDITTQSISWNISCAIPGLGQAPVPQDVTIFFKMTLWADRDIFENFPRAISPSLKLLQVPDFGSPDRGGSFQEWTNPISQEQMNPRWNLRGQKLVIDDVEDAVGLPFKNARFGEWIQEGIKIATADLRNKIPELGRKIILRSEQPLLTADIAFNLNDRAHNLRLIDFNTGELRHAKIALRNYDKIAEILSILRELQNLELVSQNDNAAKDAVIAMTFHAIGDALGLATNMRAFGLYQNWGNDLQSNMSMVYLGSPMEFFTDKVEWKAQDILSFKVIYREIINISNFEFTQVTEDLGKYQISSKDKNTLDHVANISEQLEIILANFRVSSHPRISALREHDPQWEQTLRGIYQPLFGGSK